MIREFWTDDPDFERKHAEFVKEATSTQGHYIKEVLEDMEQNGDAYCEDVDEFYHLCLREKPRLSRAQFKLDLRFLLKRGDLHREGRRLYSSNTWETECSVAQWLAAVLEDCTVTGKPLPEPLTCGGIPLNQQQREAVELALCHRISVILGGAGSGKTTLIRALSDCFPKKRNIILSAPTGKAARNLKERTAQETRTVHSAVGMLRYDDDGNEISWRDMELIVVDEASMLSLSLLDRVLQKNKARDCRIVLLGDPNQLQAIGAGNVLPDLVRLGVPTVRLEQQFRQQENAEALRYNVTHFPQLSVMDELRFDDSFQLIEAEDAEIAGVICREATRWRKQGEEVQVLSPIYGSLPFSVDSLNRALQAAWNPSGCYNANCSPFYLPFYERFHPGDRVIITRNSKRMDIWNGDVGTLNFADPRVEVTLSGNRSASWPMVYPPDELELAYALTVHKSQGSQYGTVILPVSLLTANMLYRNLFYTAISRSAQRVILVGSRMAVDTAMKRHAFQRRSTLVWRTNTLRYRAQQSA